MRGKGEGKNRGREGGREDSWNKEWIFHRGVSITPLFVSHVLILRHKQVCGAHSLYFMNDIIFTMDNYIYSFN